MSFTVAGLGIVAIILLTVISGFFSSSEIAVFSIPRHRIEMLLAENTPGASALERLREDAHSFLITALVSNNVANIAAASVATAVLVMFVPPGQAATGATIVTSVFVIAFGEIAPKSYAVANAERHALRIAPSMVVIQRVLTPILVIFAVMTRGINRITGGEAEFESYTSREEIETIVLSGETSGALDSGEGAMIRRVLDLEETTVRGVMVPRTEMIAAPATDTIDEVIEQCWKEKVTRVPVHGETRDEILGIADVRELLRIRAEGGDLRESLTPAQYVPGVKPVDELLTEMQLDGYRMAIVVDEFGTVIGLVTLEDLIEEVVGEIFDSQEVDPVRIIDTDSAVVNGWATVDYVNEQLGLEILKDGPFETIAGLVNHHLGRLAEESDQIEFGNVRIMVIDTTTRRIRRVRIEWSNDDGEEIADS